jgi:hypothetical protein
MTFSSNYEDYRASCSKIIKDSLARHVNKLPKPDVVPTLIDFDAINDEGAMPKEDCVGMSEFGVQWDNQTVIARFQIGISTFNDLTMFRARRLISIFYGDLTTMVDFPLVNAETGAQIGKMKLMNGTSVFPMVRTTVRPYWFIQAQVSHALLTP